MAAFAFFPGFSRAIYLIPSQAADIPAIALTFRLACALLFPELVFPICGGGFMSLLLHVCCAPCSVACIQQLREEGLEPVAFWYNPNIHPFTEYRARRDTARAYFQSIGVRLIEMDQYGLRPFLSALPSWDDRCATCYALRFNAAAQYAAQNGFDAFTSTLFISPYQNHPLMQQVAGAAAQAQGVSFLYRDFRPRFRSGQQQAREAGLYMQKYCGCIFSEEERYTKRKK